VWNCLLNFQLQRPKIQWLPNIPFEGDSVSFSIKDESKETSGSLVNSWQMESSVLEVSVENVPKNILLNNESTKVLLESSVQHPPLTLFVLKA